MPMTGGVGGALAGLRIVDLTRVLGGPYCTIILSDHGADVVKVEPPQGDETRDWGPPFDEAGDASYFIGVNRNKRAVALDLRQDAGREVLWRLLDGADVLVENYKPGAMEAWGMGYAELSARFPGLIHCRISGFGADGPLGGRPGYDAVLQAMTGLMSINGDGEPTRMGTPVVDLATGLYSALAIAMALHERSRSGRGQFLDMTLHDCGMSLLHPQAANWFLGGTRPRALGNPHPNISPYDAYPTATCSVFLAIGNDGQFRKLCALIGRPEMASDTRFGSNADRVRNRDALTAALRAAFATEDGRELAERLLSAGLPAGPVLTVDEAMDAPHTAARSMVAGKGRARALGTPIKMSRTPGGARTAPPRFGEHGEEILAELGYDERERRALAEGGAWVRERRRSPPPLRATAGKTAR